MNWITPTIIFLLFCISHSYLAEVSVKESIFKTFPRIRPFYRILYSLISILLLALWIYLLPNESTLVYSYEGVLKWVMIVVNISSLIVLLLVIFKLNTGVFIGTKQVRNYIKDKKIPEYLDEPEKGQLIINGFHKYIRHPLYTFSILVLITNPAMTNTEAYFSICLIIYFWIGSYFEERKLVERFGDDYQSYQKKTGRFFPNIL